MSTAFWGDVGFSKILRQACDIGIRLLPRQHVLVHIRGNNAEGNTQHFEQLFAAGRARRQNDGIHAQKYIVE
jgi:hypothetical protein